VHNAPVAGTTEATGVKCTLRHGNHVVPFSAPATARRPGSPTGVESLCQLTGASDQSRDQRGGDERQQKRQLHEEKQTGEQSS
jgi:hypothetical protein